MISSESENANAEFHPAIEKTKNTRMNRSRISSTPENANAEFHPAIEKTKNTRMNRSMISIVMMPLFFWACTQQKGPNVSHISVELETLRFEQDFFSTDTNNLSHSLDNLYHKYPGFFSDFSTHILGLPPVNDSGEEAMNMIRQFLRDYRPVYDSANKAFPDLNAQEKQIREGLRHVKYYFPDYPLPTRLITFVGPMDAFFETSTGKQGDVITADGLAVGLQLHLGSNFSMYHSEMGLALYPVYISRKFAPEYIPVNCMKNIMDDIFPDAGADRPLVEQMVEKGKRIFLLDKLLPSVDDTLKIGYTGPQLQGCYQNEGLIWNFFVKNGLVFNNDPSLIKNYIGESPNTPEFGDGAPGNIGLFVGWQIVKKYQEAYPDISLVELMQADPKELFEKSGYRPR